MLENHSKNIYDDVNILSIDIVFNDYILFDL